MQQDINEALRRNDLRARHAREVHAGDEGRSVAGHQACVGSDSVLWEVRVRKLGVAPAWHPSSPARASRIARGPPSRAAHSATRPASRTAVAPTARTTPSVRTNLKPQLVQLVASRQPWPTPLAPSSFPAARRRCCFFARIFSREGRRGGQRG